MACCTTIQPSSIAQNNPSQKRAYDYDQTMTATTTTPSSTSNKRRKYHLNSTMYTTLKHANSSSTNPFIHQTNSTTSTSSNTSSFVHQQTTASNQQLMERIRNEAKRFIRRRQCSPLIATTHSIPTPSTNATTDTAPLFTMSQVNAICEKLLKEREDSLREQYDLILDQKLNQQYDAFVKFTHEQLQKKFENSQFSYVS